MTVIERISLCLKEKGYKQTDLAKALSEKGVTKQTITDWKKNKSSSYYELMPEIAAFLSTTTDHLFTGNKKMPLPDMGAAGLLNAAIEAAKLTDGDGMLTEESAKVVSDFILANADMLKKLVSNDL